MSVDEALELRNKYSKKIFDGINYKAVLKIVVLNLQELRPNDKNHAFYLDITSEY